MNKKIYISMILIMMPALAFSMKSSVKKGNSEDLLIRLALAQATREYEGAQHRFEAMSGHHFSLKSEYSFHVNFGEGSASSAYPEYSASKTKCFIEKLDAFEHELKNAQIKLDRARVALHDVENAARASLQESSESGLQ